MHALAESSGAFAVTHEGDNWLELLVSGLAFDLNGLADGPAAAVPSTRHDFGFEDIAREPIEAIELVAGPHLAGGAAMIPVVRSQFALALHLAALPGLEAVAWEPAQSRMAAEYFVRTVSAWLEGGAFPALGLTAVVPAVDRGLISRGLAHFTGQELRIEPELAEDRVAATKLAVRLLNELVANEPVSEPVAFDGPDGASLVLEPSANGRFVRVRAAG